MLVKGAPGRTFCVTLFYGDRGDTSSCKSSCGKCIMNVSLKWTQSAFSGYMFLLSQHRAYKWDKMLSIIMCQTVLWRNTNAKLSHDANSRTRYQTYCSLVTPNGVIGLVLADIAGTEPQHGGMLVKAWTNVHCMVNLTLTKYASWFLIKTQTHSPKTKKHVCEMVSCAKCVTCLNVLNARLHMNPYHIPRPIRMILLVNNLRLQCFLRLLHPCHMVSMVMRHEKCIIHLVREWKTSTLKWFGAKIYLTDMTEKCIYLSYNIYWFVLFLKDQGTKC